MVWQKAREDDDQGQVYAFIATISSCFLSGANAIL